MKYLKLFLILFLTNIAIGQTPVNQPSNPKQIFAKVDSNNNVVNVIVSTSDYIITLADASSYVEGSITGAIRYNRPIIGGTFDTTNNAFITPSSYPSFTLNTSTFKWEAPIPKPAEIYGYRWYWNETNKNWISIMLPNLPKSILTTNNATP
jgi:hypothetical protein